MEKEEGIIIEEKIRLKTGECKVRKYLQKGLIGKGAFAKCYHMTCLDTLQPYASKVILKSSLSKHIARQKLIDEVKIHRALQHPHVVQLHHVFEDHLHVYLLLELCPHQTLQQLLKRRKRLSEQEVQVYLSQLLDALEYLHANRVIHRDLKLDNLFLAQHLQLKLGDFGLAAKLDYCSQQRKTICGTPNYIAPEVLDCLGHSFMADVWALGVVMFTLLVGRPPFQSQQQHLTYLKIRKNSFTFPVECPVGGEAKGLILWILSTQPQQRPTLQQIRAHPFMQGAPTRLSTTTLICPPCSSFQQQSQSHQLQQQQQQQHQQDEEEEKEEEEEEEKEEEEEEEEEEQKVKIEQLENNLDTPPPEHKIEIIVTHLLDYSSKYGLGYQLSNGTQGVSFNDSSKMVSQPSHNTFHYILRKRTKTSNNYQDISQLYTFAKCPGELASKVTVFQHFSSYFQEHWETREKGEQLANHFVYVKYWVKNTKGILLRLSNKVVQFKFNDQTQIILSAEMKYLTYIANDGQKTSLLLENIMESCNQEIKKKLLFTKETLNYMLNPQRNQKIVTKK